MDFPLCFPVFSLLFMLSGYQLKIGAILGTFFFLVLLRSKKCKWFLRGAGLSVALHRSIFFSSLSPRESEANVIMEQSAFWWVMSGCFLVICPS